MGLWKRTLATLRNSGEFYKINKHGDKPNSSRVKPRKKQATKKSTFLYRTEYFGSKRVANFMVIKV